MTDYRLPGPDGWANTEVVGTFYHQAEILRALGRKPRVDEDMEVTVDAHLVLEPDNPHGTHAISVRVKGQVVGYISREEDESYWNDLGRIAASGHTPVTTARIWGTYRKPWDGRGQSKLESRVTLILREPHFLTPGNNAPAEKYSTLPWGSGLQVLKEEDHFDVLFNYVPSGGVGLLLLTLHRGTKRLKNGTEKAFIEIRLDGEHVGEMSGVTSAHFLPVVEHMETMGVIPVAWATIKGSALAAQLTLQAAKSTEIPDSWIIGPPSLVPTFVNQAEDYDVPPTFSGARAPRGSASNMIQVNTAPGPEIIRQPGLSPQIQPAPVPSGSQTAGQRPTKAKRGTQPTDEQRKYSPTLHRMAGISMIVIGVVLGSLLALIPGIGLILFMGAVWLGIYGNIVRRRVAKALEIETGTTRTSIR